MNKKFYDDSFAIQLSRVFTCIFWFLFYQILKNFSLPIRKIVCMRGTLLCLSDFAWLTGSLFLVIRLLFLVALSNTIVWRTQIRYGCVSLKLYCNVFHKYLFVLVVRIVCMTFVNLVQLHTYTYIHTNWLVAANTNVS